VPLVVGGIVDKHTDRAEAIARHLDGRLERRDVGDVTGDELGTGLGSQRPAIGLEDINEGDLAALAGEGADDVGTDAARSASDEYNPSGQARILCESRNFLKPSSRQRAPLKERSPR
jgi:hypothetical protein